ncbi:MAG TPA: helix-turn-helix transcriptional regulator [Nocardioides sp.]|nr:helix-turn-helix transcriptional regulator [Nocardioides sp.]
MERRTNGAAVRVIRDALGVSNPDLAARAEISTAYLAMVESGSRQPSPSVARKLADGLGIPLESITYPACDHEPATAAS